MLLTCVHIPPDIFSRYENPWHFVCPEILSCIHGCQEIFNKQKKNHKPNKGNKLLNFIKWNNSNKLDMTFSLKESLDIFYIMMHNSFLSLWERILKVFYLWDKVNAKIMPEYETVFLEWAKLHIFRYYWEREKSLEQEAELNYLDMGVGVLFSFKEFAENALFCSII